MMTQEEITRDMRRLKEQEEEKKWGTQLSNQGHLHVNQELVDVQSTLDLCHGEGCVPASIQEAMDTGER